MKTELKYCNKCDIPLPYSDFPKGKNTCKPCQSKYNKAYHAGKKQPVKPAKTASKYERSQGKVITGIKEKKNPILDWDCLTYKN